MLDPLLCDVLRKKGNPPDEKLTWQVATQRYKIYVILVARCVYALSIEITFPANLFD